MEIRRSCNRLISTMGFPLLVRWHLYIESGPRYFAKKYSLPLCSGWNVLGELGQYHGCWWPWVYVLPGHQQPRYWHYRINRSFSSIRKDINCLCHLSVKKRKKMQIHIHVSLKMFITSRVDSKQFPLRIIICPFVSNWQELLLDTELVCFRIKYRACGCHYNITLRQNIT